MKFKDRFILIGKVMRTQGIKGKLKVRPFADPEFFASLKDAYLGKDEGVKPYRVVSLQSHKGAILLGLDGIETIALAEEFVGHDLFAEKDALEKLPAGEYYRFQIIDLEAYTKDGLYLGKVKEILSTGSNDVYVIREGAKEYLVPAIEEVVKEINIAERRMIISPIKGLLGEE